MFTDAPATVARVDLRRYLGRWFEIARLPNRRQGEDCSDVACDYTLADDGSIRVTQRCVDPTGACRREEGVLKRGSDGSHARLRISFAPSTLRWLPFSHRDYWILRLDADYTMSLVGTPGRRRLWLLARARHPDPSMRDAFLAHAAALGYDLTALIHTQQDRTPQVTATATTAARAGDAQPAAAPANATRPTTARTHR